MRLFGVDFHLGGSTTLDEIEQADQEYNALRESGDADSADDLADTLHRKGFLPHWDRDNQIWYFVDPHAAE